MLDTELQILIKHYAALVFIAFVASQMPAVRAASAGKGFNINLYRFILSAILVLLTEQLIARYVPNFVQPICFFIAFFCEELYDYARKTLFNKLKSKFEKKYFDDSDTPNA